MRPILGRVKESGDEWTLQDRYGDQAFRRRLPNDRHEVCLFPTDLSSLGFTMGGGQISEIASSYRRWVAEEIILGGLIKYDWSLSSEEEESSLTMVFEIIGRASPDQIPSLRYSLDVPVQKASMRVEGVDFEQGYDRRAIDLKKVSAVFLQLGLAGEAAKSFEAALGGFWLASQRDRMLALIHKSAVLKWFPGGDMTTGTPGKISEYMTEVARLFKAAKDEVDLEEAIRRAASVPIQKVLYGDSRTEQGVIGPNSGLTSGSPTIGPTTIGTNNVRIGGRKNPAAEALDDYVRMTNKMALFGATPKGPLKLVPPVDPVAARFAALEVPDDEEEK